MAFILFWIVCGVVAGVIGAQKGSGCLATALGFALGPLGIVIALVMQGDRVQCPYCREFMQKDASVCPHCQRTVSQRGDVSSRPRGEHGISPAELDRQGREEGRR
jgi:hypothetical protein